MKKIFLLLISCIAISCSNNDDNEPFVPVAVDYSIKFRGELGGFNYYPNSPDTEKLKITNSTEYLNYFNTLMTSPISVTFGEDYSFFPEPDFNVKDILVINYKCISDLGQVISIDSIIENENTITVTYHWEQLYSGPTAPGKPFILVEVPKLTKPVVFEDITP